MTDLRTAVREATARLAAAGMVLDCCALPHGDARGLRLGTAAVTTQGMEAADMAEIASLIARALRHRDDDRALAEVRSEVNVLCGKYPPYPTA